MSKEKIYDIASDLYFEVISYLGIYDECVKKSEQGGTENTKKGRELYYSIENFLMSKLRRKNDSKRND